MRYVKFTTITRAIFVFADNIQYIMLINFKIVKIMWNLFPKNILLFEYFLVLLFGYFLSLKMFKIYEWVAYNDTIETAQTVDIFDDSITLN